MQRSRELTFASTTLLLVLSAASAAYAYDLPTRSPAATLPPSQTFALTDTKDLIVEPGVRADAVEYLGRKAVRLTKDAVDEPALAYINGTQFRDGVIEVDVATKMTRASGDPASPALRFEDARTGSTMNCFTCVLAMPAKTIRRNATIRFNIPLNLILAGRSCGAIGLSSMSLMRICKPTSGRS